MKRRTPRAELLWSSLFLVLGAVACASGCGHSAGSSPATGDDAAVGDDASTGDDAGGGDSSSPDASTGEGGGVDGTPMRNACTGSFGSAITTTFGRLDGFLVSIVPVGHRGCNGDTTHVHLQVLAQNSVYDVAVNVDGMFHEQDITLPDGAWSEGWHTNVTDNYPSLGAHSSQFVQSTVAALGAEVEMKLAQANHVAVFATGYGPTGVHLVHWRGHGADGMVVMNPLSPAPHALMFAFQGDTF